MGKMKSYWIDIENEVRDIPSNLQEHEVYDALIKIANRHGCSFNEIRDLYEEYHGPSEPIFLAD